MAIVGGIEDRSSSPRKVKGLCGDLTAVRATWEEDRWGDNDNNNDDDNDNRLTF